MHVRTKLADIDFVIGRIEYKKDHLIIHSDPEKSMEGKAYVSPNDVLTFLGKVLLNPRLWLYFLVFPFHLVRYRRRHQRKKHRSA